MCDSTKAAQIVKEHHDCLFRYALALCHRNHCSAMGIVQQTYLEILEGRANIEAAERPRAFLMGVARKIAARERRRQSVWSRITKLIPFDSGDFAKAQNPEEIITSDEQHRDLELALKILSTRQLEILTLVFGEEMTIEQAAGELNISLGSARTHYHRAKKKLGERLKEYSNVEGCIGKQDSRGVKKLPSALV